MAGAVFKEVAERTIILKSKRVPEKVAPDSLEQVPHWPVAPGGNNHAVRKVAERLNMPYTAPACNWVKPAGEPLDKPMAEEMKLARGRIPDVTGLGAKDASYLLGSLGLEVRMKGRGKVTAQSRKPGSSLGKGGIIELQLQ